MTPAQRDAYVEFAVTAAAAAGAAILPHFRAPIAVVDKGGARGYDPVTEADRAAESVIRTAIAQAFPDHGICGEEHGPEPGRDPWTWATLFARVVAINLIAKTTLLDPAVTTDADIFSAESAVYDRLLPSL